MTAFPSRPKGTSASFLSMASSTLYAFKCVHQICCSRFDLRESGYHVFAANCPTLAGGVAMLTRAVGTYLAVRRAADVQGGWIGRQPLVFVLDFHRLTGLCG